MKINKNKQRYYVHEIITYPIEENEPPIFSIRHFDTKEEAIEYLKEAKKMENVEAEIVEEWE